MGWCFQKVLCYAMYILSSMAHSCHHRVIIAGAVLILQGTIVHMIFHNDQRSFSCSLHVIYLFDLNGPFKENKVLDMKSIY